MAALDRITAPPRRLLFLVLAGGCAPKAEPRPWASPEAWPAPPPFGVAGYAVLEGRAAWADGAPAARRTVWISCPPGQVLYRAQTDSAGRYQQWLGLPALVLLPESRRVECQVRLEERPYDPQQPERLVSVYFARTPPEIRPTRAPALVARRSAAFANLPTERVHVRSRFVPLPPSAPADSLARAWVERGTLYVRGPLPLSGQPTNVIVAATRTGPEVDVLVQVGPGTGGAHDVRGPAAYEVGLPGLPAGVYTVTVQTMVLRSPVEGRTFLPERRFGGVVVPGR